MASSLELVALQETLYRSGNPTRRWLHCIRRDWIVAALHRHAQRLRQGVGSNLLWTQYYVVRGAQGAGDAAQ